MDQDTPFQKFIIIISALIVFTICMMIGVNLLGYILSPSSNPYLVSGLVPGNIPLIIQQDPSIKGSIPIERANNETYGLEFSWSVWLNITDLGKTGEYQHIFHKGDNHIQTEGDNIGMNFPNNAPGLYLSPTTNELIVVMNTFTTINEEIKIPNIPMNKWMHLVIRIENNNVDTYVNGTLAKRHVLASVPKQNYGNVNVGLNGGFQGYLSDLRYFSHALQPGEIVSIVDSGPNLKVNKQTTSGLLSNPPYLSLQWYTQDVK